MQVPCLKEPWQRKSSVTNELWPGTLPSSATSTPGRHLTAQVFCDLFGSDANTWPPPLFWGVWYQGQEYATGVIIAPTEIVSSSLCLGISGLGKGLMPSGKLKPTVFGFGCGEDYNSQKALETFLTKNNYSSQKALDWPQVPCSRTTCQCQILPVKPTDVFLFLTRM